MQSAAAELDFERAQIYKNSLEMLQQHYSKSLIVHPSITNIDVFSLIFEEYKVYGNFLRLNNGCIIKALNLEFKMNIEEEHDAVLSRFIQEIYNIAGEDIEQDDGGVSMVKEVLVPFMPDQEFEGKHIHIPLRGDKLNLLELSTKNANAFKFQRLKQDALKCDEEGSAAVGEELSGSNRAVVMLQRDLNMDRLPLHIECFDNSNIQGTNPVAACVVFKNGRPSKRDYRHFNVKGVVGANDFASMREIVYRRYSRLLEEEAPLPQLILIDGGKGQLHFAHDALMELGLHKKIKLISIAERLEELPPMKIYEGEYAPEDAYVDGGKDTVIRRENDTFFVTGEWLKNLMGQINFSDYESLNYFQRVLQKSGVFESLEAKGCRDGHTVNIYDFEFDYVK